MFRRLDAVFETGYREHEIIRGWAFTMGGIRAMSRNNRHTKAHETKRQAHVKEAIQDAAGSVFGSGPDAPTFRIGQVVY